MAGNGICSAAFCESAALWAASSPSQALTRQLSQRESLWRSCAPCNWAGSFPATAEAFLHEGGGIAAGNDGRSPYQITPSVALRAPAVPLFVTFR